MPRPERSGSVSIRRTGNEFLLPNRHITHKSWHRKDSSASLRRFAITNVYKYKKSDVVSRLTNTPPTVHNKPSLPVGLTIKTKQTHPSNPKPLTFVSSNVKEKERACTNIHINPLFTAGSSKEKNAKSWQKLPYQSPSYVPLNAPQGMSASIPPSESGDLQPIAAHSFNSRPSTINTNTFNGNNAGSKENTFRCPSTNLEHGENRPSIHVNPSVLVSSTAKFHNDILKHSNIVHLRENYGTQHQLSTQPNNPLASVHVNPLVHGASSTTPTVAESQRLVHVNPALLASNMAAQQAANAKTSVHVNPKVYARLKSEVRKEKPQAEILVTPNKTKLVPAGSNNKSLIAISRTKLIREGLPRGRKHSYRRSQQSAFNTPKTRKVISLRTPPSAVVKVAKLVCSKYKFIRKSSQTTPNPTSAGAINKTFSFVRTKYKLDRRSQKTPRPVKKVKPYSVRYDNTKRNNTESNLQGIMVHKRLSSSRNFGRGSRVWKNPGTLEPKKVVITNRKLFKIGNSPNVKSKRNKISTHKTLVRLGGVLYKTSRMKLTRTRTPKNKSLGYKEEHRQSFVRKSSNRNRVLHVRGDKFLMDRSGRTLKRVSNKLERNGLLKRIDIGGVTFIQKSKNVLIRTNTHNARNVVSQAKSKSIALLTMRMQKNNTHCRFYRRLGKCIGKEKGRCPCVHDPKYITICKKLLLTGECNVDGCLLSHEMIPEKMAICKFFMQGCCSRDACAYLHVRCDQDAAICVSFLQGYCADGSNCRKRHLYVCPQFDKTGKCPKSKYCPYPHKLKENFTLNLDHMHRCVGDILEVSSNRDEPKTVEFRYFRFKSADLNVSSQTGDGQAVNGGGLDAETGVLGKGQPKGDEEIETDLNMVEEVVQRRRLFDEFFSLIHSDLTEMDSQWDDIDREMRMKYSNQDSFNITRQGESQGVDHETRLQVRTDRETEFQMTYVDRLLRQNRCDFMPVNDDEWEKIESTQRTTRKHREEIGRLLQERAIDRQLRSTGSTSEDIDTAEKDGYQLVTGDWIDHILQQCEVIRVELQALASKKIGGWDGGQDGHEKHISLILSTLMLIKKVSKLLRELVTTRGNKLSTAENSHIDKNSSFNFRVSSSLVNLLQDLLSNLNTKHVLDGNDGEHHRSIRSESSSACTYQVQDIRDENDIQHKIAPCSQYFLDTFPSSEGEEGQNFTSKRPGIGTIPTFIPLK